MPRPMKQSDVEWLGEIPADWEIVSVGRLFTISAGGDAKPEYYSDVQDNAHPYPVYTNSMNKNQVYAYTSKPIYSANTITVTGRGAIGTAFYRDTPYDAIIRLLSLSPKMDLDCRFYAYWISNVIHFFTDSAAVGQLSSVQMSSYKTAYCSKDEQQRIATFLDGECARIDSVIEKTRASIVEYKKLKQAVITRAVTKGIRPARPMKDSGVEWLGEIPADWEIIKIKWLLNERNERSENGKEEPLSMSQKYGLIPTKEMDIVPNMATSFIGAKLCYKNDLVFNKLKAHLGVFAVSKYYGLVSPDYSVYYASNNVNLKYLEYLFKTPQYIGEFRKKSTGVGAGLTRLYTAGLYSIYCLFPPMEEQKEIAKYLDEKTAAIDLLVEKKNQLATELERLKKSLIFEYVTGKKAVAQ